MDSTSRSALGSLSHDLDCENDETDCLLVVANDIENIVKIQPRPLPEALGADERADKSPKSEAARGTKRMTPPEGSRGERAFVRGPLLIFQMWIVDISNKSHCFSRTMQTIHLILNSTCLPKSLVLR